MKTILTFLGVVLLINVGNGQITSSRANKTKLAYLDSLLNVMREEKNALVLLLNDFLQESNNLEKYGNRSIIGKTINDRITSVRAVAQKRGNTVSTNRSFEKLEKIATKIVTAQAQTEVQKKRWKDKKDSLSEMSETDILMLQQLMEKKNQLESMISNTMKAGYKGGQAAVQALKAS